MNEQEAFAAKMEAAVKAHAENPAEAWSAEVREPARPAGVPASAMWDAERVAWNETTGAMRRLWAMNGALLREIERDGELALRVTAYYPDGSVAAKVTHDAAANRSRHESWFRGGAPWSVVEYAGPIDQVVAPADVLTETLHGPNGKLLRELTHDTFGPTRRQYWPDGDLAFESRSVDGGRDLRLHAGTAADVVLHVRGDRVTTIPWEGASEVVLATKIPETAGKAEIEAPLGRLLFEATVLAMPRPAAVDAFAEAHPWATKVETAAPFAHAAMVNFLTALGSANAYVRQLALIGIHNLGYASHGDEIDAVIEELADVPGFAEGVADFRKSVSSDDEDDEEDDDDGDAPAVGEITLGSVTLPSGDLVLTDMGAMGQWSHDAPHHADTSGSTWANVVGAKRDDYVDHVVTGKDAVKAFLAFAKEHGHYLYDVTRLQSENGKKLFAELMKKEGLDASLEVASARIGHGARLAILKELGVPWGRFKFAHVNVVGVFGLPRDRELPVVAERSEDGTWATVSLVCKPTAAVRSEKIGGLVVEEARFMFADAEALRAWDHERPVDGQHDFVMWNADDLAEAVGAEDAYPGGSSGGTVGFVDMPPFACPPQIVGAMLAASEARELNAELRPHSSHHAILRGAWSSPHEAGTALIGGAKICGLFTTVGDGVFAVHADRDADGDICRIRVDIAGE